MSVFVFPVLSKIIMSLISFSWWSFVYFLWGLHPFFFLFHNNFELQSFVRIKYLPVEHAVEILACLRTWTFIVENYINNIKETGLNSIVLCLIFLVAILKYMEFFVLLMLGKIGEFYSVFHKLFECFRAQCIRTNWYVLGQPMRVVPRG